MSSNLYKVFEEVESQATALSDYWDNFYSEIFDYLPPSNQREIQDLKIRLAQARIDLITELHYPVLTIATTGTTSSGKSTLVNMLCGAAIVPVAVEEKSAGVVTIEYSEEKSLEISNTSGATWECGQWTGIEDKEIYKRLDEVMKSYIAGREHNPSLSCPQVFIRFPFRLLKESNLELPQGTKVKIMDLPGLSYSGDEINANVIRKCKEALCIVAYNSEENNPQTIKALLQEVVSQVKALRGSPARMLFVLNKIDVFRRNDDWPDSEKLWVEKTTKNIKIELTERLKEYTKEIENLQVVRLSTMPALLSIQIQGDDDELSISACKKAREHFFGLIEDLLDTGFPSSIQKWGSHDRSRVGSELWEKSYANEFQEHLKDHVTNHFPKLVIPQMLDRFGVSAGDVVEEWVVQTTSAILNSSEENYTKERSKIAQIRTELKQVLKESSAKLRKPFETVSYELNKANNPDPIEVLLDIVSDFMNVAPYNNLGDALYPLYAWSKELKAGITEVLTAVARSLETGKISLVGTNLKKSNPRNIILLESNLVRLVEAGYTTTVAKDGKKKEARTESDKKNLLDLNRELNNLAHLLSLVMEDVLQQICKQELDRIHDAVVKLFNCHLDYLENGVKRAAKDMAITFPKSQLVKVEKQPTITFTFQAGFPITKGTWQEAKTVTITVQEAHERNTKGKSGWDWLGGTASGFFGNFVWDGVVRQKTYTDYVERSNDNAEIPKVREMLEGWLVQAQSEEVKVADQIINWLLEEIDY